MVERDLLAELRELCHPVAEVLCDKVRIDRFVHLGNEVADEMQVLINALGLFKDRATALSNQTLKLATQHVEVMEEYARETDRLQAQVKALQKTNAEAVDNVENLLRHRTGFTGDFPYHGWRGVGRVIKESLDELDIYRATLAEILDSPEQSTVLVRTALRLAKVRS